MADVHMAGAGDCFVDAPADGDEGGSKDLPVARAPVGHGEGAQQIANDNDNFNDNDNNNDESQVNRRDSRLPSSPTKQHDDGPATEATPTDCIGHMDREDGLAPKPRVKRAVTVAWTPWDIRASSADAHGSSGSVTFKKEYGLLGKGLHEREEGEHEASPSSYSIGAFLEAADVTPDAIVSALTGLTPSGREVLEEGEDLYFATRLASAAVILYGRGWGFKVKTLAQWSVDLVGKSMWDRMVLDFGEAADECEDDETWAAYLLAEVVINLEKLDEGRAAELREVVAALREDGVLPEEA